MILKQLIDMWRDNSLMKGVLQQLGDMVADADYIHQRAWELAKNPGTGDPAALKERDKGINKREREIRRLLLEHLIVNPKQDVSGCLSVMSLAKDLERVGDLAQSLYTLGKKHQEPISTLPMFEQYDELHRMIAGQFPRLRIAVVQSDEAVAHQVLAQYQQIKIKAKSLSKALYTTEMPARTAVTASLVAHTMHRLNAHQGNAATAVVFPLENIDYVGRGLRQEMDED